MGEEETRQGLIKLEAGSKMNELRIQALLNILSKEGITTKEEFEEELESLCRGQEEKER